MSTKKTIQINQDFLNSNNGGNNNNRTLKNRERKEKPKIVIKPNNLKKQLLQKIKNYQNKDEIMQTNVNLPVTFDTPPNAKIDNIDADSDFGGEFNKSLNFLQNLSLQKNATKNNNNANKNSNNTNNNNHKTLKKKKVKNTMPQVATDLPPELCIQTTIPTSMPTANMPTANMHAIMPIVEEVVNENIISRDHSPQLILREQPLYSSLKNGSKPTYRQVHNKTQKITHFHTPVEQTPIQQPMQMPAPIQLTAFMQAPVQAPVQPPIQTPVVIEEPIIKNEILAEENPMLSDNSANNETQEPTILKKKITRTLKYKLGKKGNKVSILIKNGKTRKIIQHEQALLKKKSILDVKNYLRKKNLLKIGSEAPPDILRQIYENSILAGDLNNKSKETLIHNYMNDK